MQPTLEQRLEWFFGAPLPEKYDYEMDRNGNVIAVWDTSEEKENAA